jgi:hypothetical protein
MPCFLRSMIPSNATPPTAIIGHAEGSGTTDTTASPKGTARPPMKLALITAPVWHRIRQSCCCQSSRRRALQSPCADRSLQRPGKPGSLLQVRTQIKILRVPRLHDAVAPRQNPGLIRFVALWPRSLPIRSGPLLVCVGLSRRHRLPLPPPAL